MPLPPISKIETNKSFPLASPFIVYMHKSLTLGKAYAIKVWCYWELFGEHNENFRGTPLEIDGNTLGTAQKKTKIQTPTHNPFHTRLYPLLFASSLDSNLSKFPRKEVILWPPWTLGGVELHTCVLFVRNQKKRNNRTTIYKPSQIMHSFSHAIKERHSQDLCAINQSIKQQ